MSNATIDTPKVEASFKTYREIRLEEALAKIEEILYDDLANRPSERARKAVMALVSKALYG